MSTTAFFIAVQCCQCSTMQVLSLQSLTLFVDLDLDLNFFLFLYFFFQSEISDSQSSKILWFFFQVKQRSKKSSNKWTCVVCNQKQSVRKVLAQGSMAKQLRPFVQSFNMSRHHSEQRIIHHHVNDDKEEEEERNPQSTKKPRIDWSDYLEAPNENSHAKIGDGENYISIFLFYSINFRKLKYIFNLIVIDSCSCRFGAKDSDRVAHGVVQQTGSTQTYDFLFFIFFSLILSFFFSHVFPC